MNDTPLLGRLVWYELLTTDMKAAEKFYSAVVGWKVKPFEGSPQPYDVLSRNGDSGVGGVMKIPEGMNFPPHWVMYIAVPNIDETIAKIERLGGSTLSPPIEVPNVGRLRTMLDPQGAMFALLQPSMPEGRPEQPPQVGEASWHELYTTDAPAALKFYSDVFGWKPTTSFDMGEMGKYYMFGRAFELGGMMTKPASMSMVPTAWSIYFRVPDINAAVEKVKSNGGKVMNGPMEVPGGDLIAQCTDPQGAAFSLHQSKSG